MSRNKTAYNINPEANSKACKQRYLLPALSYLLFVLCSLLFVRCNAPYLEMSPPPSGYGSFTLSFADNSRTIMPKPDLDLFAVYELIFTPIPTFGGEDRTVDRTNTTLATEPVILVTGTYSLVVNAYRNDDAGTSVLAAVGKLDSIEIKDGEDTSGKVELVIIPYTDGTETGTFSWDITLDIDSAFTLTKADMTVLQGSVIQNDGEVDLQVKGKGEIPLYSGIYTVLFTLEGHETDLTDKDIKRVVWSEMLYIYAGMESPFKFEFTDAHFHQTYWTVTFDHNYQDGSIIPQTVIHGDTVEIPLNPTQDGFVFAGWHTDADCNDEFDFATQINRDITLYAKWIEVFETEFTLTVKYTHIEDSAPSIGDKIILYKTEKVGYPKTVTLTVEDPPTGSTVNWRVLGANTTVPGVTGNGPEFELNATNPAYGAVGVERALVMTIEIGGIVYNRTIPFVIRELPPYVITGTVALGFTAMLGTETIGAAGQPIQAVIDAIKIDAEGMNCEIQFGTGGTNVLNIGANGIIFDGGSRRTDWGTITLSGNISSTITSLSYAPDAVVTLNNGVSIDVNGNITATSSGIAINNQSNGEIFIRGNTTISSANTAAAHGTIVVGAGTLTMDGGTVRNTTSTTTSARAINATTGTVNIRGGIVGAMSSAATPVGTRGTAIGMTGAGEINISGADTIIISASDSEDNGTILVFTGTLNMTGGTVRNTANAANARAITLTTGTVNIQGGTVGAMTAADPPVGTIGTAIGKSGTAAGGQINISQADPLVQTLITSASENADNGTVQVSNMTLNITGGIVRNTADSQNARAIIATTGTLNIQGGTVGAMTDLDGNEGTAGTAIAKTGTGGPIIISQDTAVPTLITSASETALNGTIQVIRLSMRGGTVRNTSTTASENVRAIYIMTNNTAGMPISISGGTVSATAASAYAVYHAGNGVLTIDWGKVGIFGDVYPTTTMPADVVALSDGMNATEIATRINNALASEDTVTVIGSANATGTLNLNIAGSKKVIWNAEYSGLLDGWPLISITGGGDFEVSNNALIENTGSLNSGGIGIEHDNVNILVSGGKVTADYSAIRSAGSGGKTITVNGGFLRANNSTIETISPDNIITINNGTVDSSWLPINCLATGNIVIVNGGTVTTSGDYIPLGLISFGSTNLLFFNTGTVTVTPTLPAHWFTLPDTNDSVAIERTATTNNYTAGTNTDLKVEPADATASWANNGSLHGISYLRGGNSGFIEVPGVTVTP